MAKIRSPRILAFVHEYVWGEDAGNGTQCAMTVGLCTGNRDSAGRYAITLLRKPAVKALVEAESAEKEALLKQKWTRAVEEAFAIATADIGDMLDEGGKFLPMQRGTKDGKGNPLRMPDRERRAIASFEVETRYEGRGEDAEAYTVTKIKLHPKQPAIEFIAKVAGKLKDTVKHEGLSLEELVLAADRKAREKAKSG